MGAREFQSAPGAVARGNTLGPPPGPESVKVSIRPRRLHKGKSAQVIVRGSEKVFQSAPGADARGNQRGVLENLKRKEFQSAPGADARGNPVKSQVLLHTFYVSIRPRR